MCANTFNLRAKHALECELAAAKYLITKKYQLLWHRREIHGVEIDFLFWHEKYNLVLIEVKSNGANWSLSDRLKLEQLRRLKHTQMYLEGRLKFKVHMQIVVLCNAAVDVYDLDDLLF